MTEKRFPYQTQEGVYMAKMQSEIWLCVLLLVLGHSPPPDIRADMCVSEREMTKLPKDCSGCFSTCEAFSPLTNLLNCPKSEM